MRISARRSWAEADDGGRRWRTSGDAEAVRFPTAIAGHPRLLVRAPVPYIDGAGSIKTIAVGISDATSISLIRQDANTIASGFTLPEPIEVGPRYRISVAVEGNSMPIVDVTIEREDAPGSWSVMGTDSWTDTNQPGFIDPGTAGVAMNGGSDAVFDDFCLTLLKATRATIVASVPRDCPMGGSGRSDVVSPG